MKRFVAMASTDALERGITGVTYWFRCHVDLPTTRTTTKRYVVKVYSVAEKIFMS